MQRKANGRVTPPQLNSYFDRSASAVQVYADHFERDYARPALQASRQLFRERPISSTFVSVFTLLSFFPVVSFLGFSLFTVVSLVLVALSGAFIVSIILLILFFFILILALLVTFSMSLFLTFFVIVGYAALRLSTHVKQEGPKTGVMEWAEEAKRQILPRPLTGRERERGRGHQKPISESGSEVSLVVVGKPEQSGGQLKQMEEHEEEQKQLLPQAFSGVIGSLKEAIATNEEIEKEVKAEKESFVVDADETLVDGEDKGLLE